MNRTKLFVALVFYFFAVVVSAQSRSEIKIPNIGKYQTLKCDFHMHSVFSDGQVWPTVRIDEAWEQGLDAIALTDHIEYRPHSDDIKGDHNRSFEIARSRAKEMNIILIQGTEITRSMPPGHLNALFINDANAIDRSDVTEAIAAAHAQGAFLVWNHPCWKAQQPDTTLWFTEHTRLSEQNMMHGIEVFNGEFCPEAFEWAHTKNLTVFANTDAHDPIAKNETSRPLTLVFATERNSEAIKDALFNRRTVAFFNNTVAGEEIWLKQLFFAAVETDDTPLKLVKKARRKTFIKNNSDIDFELELTSAGKTFSAPPHIVLKANETTPVEFGGKLDEVTELKNIKVEYLVKNLKTGANENLLVSLSFVNN